MKRILTSLMVLFALVACSCAQTKEKEASVIQMNKQMFLDKVFDYTTGATEWKYQGDKPAVIDFYATWCGPCRMIAPILKDLAKEYGESIIVYKVDTDKEKELYVESFFAHEIRHAIQTHFQLSTENLPIFKSRANSISRLVLLFPLKRTFDISTPAL